MENEGFAKVRIENEGDTNGRRWNLFIPSVAFIASVLLGVAISRFSPIEYKCISRTAVSLNLPENKWVLHLENMKPENQQLLLLSRETHPSPDKELIFNQSYDISVWGSNFPVKDEAGNDTCINRSCHNCSSCEYISHVERKVNIVCAPGAVYCDWKVDYFTRFLHYPTYYVEVDVVVLDYVTAMKELTDEERNEEMNAEFELFYKSENYARFILRVNSCFFIITLVFMFFPKLGFFTQLIKVNPQFWSKQQKYIALLLVGLLLFNNPLFNIPAVTPYLYILHLYEASWITDITFICMLLFFWLLTLTDMVEAGSAAALSGNSATSFQQRSKSFILAIRTREAILVALIWLSSMLMYSNKRFHMASGSPLKEDYFLSDSLFFDVIKVLRIFFGMIYFFWILVLIFRTIRLVRALAMVHRIIYGATLFTLLCTYFGVVWDRDMIDPKGSLFFASIYNGYVLTLAWSYTPSGTGYSNVDQKELELTGVEEWMEDDTLSDGEGSFDFGGH
eukprot:330070_1